MFSEYPDILSVKDIVKMLGISKEKVYKLVKQEQLPVCRLSNKNIYFLKEEIIKYLKSK